MNIKRIGAAALAALMATTAVTASALSSDDLVWVGDEAEPAFGYYEWGNFKLTKTPRAGLHIEPISDEKRADITELTVPAFDDGDVEFISSISDVRNCQNLKSVTILGYHPVLGLGIDPGAFEGCTNLTDIYFAGSEEEWNSMIFIADNNDAFKNAAVHFNSTGPDDSSAPSTGGDTNSGGDTPTTTPSTPDNTDSAGNTNNTDNAGNTNNTDNTGSSSNNADKDNPETGAQGIALALGTAALAGAAVVIYRKRK